MDDITEHNLIQALKQGSHKAFELLYQMYAKRLYAYCLQFTKSVEDSEDIVQEVFIKLWTNHAKIKQEDTLSSLLFIMAKHHLINTYRTRLLQPVFEDYLAYTEKLSVDDTHYKVEYDEFVRQVRKIMETLPTTQQKVIALSRFQQLSNKEIAKKLSLSEQTVKNQLSIGIKSLREKLGGFMLSLVFLTIFMRFLWYFF